jgi:ADP-ribosylglycohydrolase
MNNHRKHVSCSLHALAVADAMTWQAMYHRSTLLPLWTRRIRREIDAESESTHVSAIPMPFSLNQPAEFLSLSPTDDTEWGVFTMKAFLDVEDLSGFKSTLKHWQELAIRQQPIRGPVSAQSALSNLRRGLEPPASGRDNPQHNDDGAMIRSLIIGLAHAGHPDNASEIAKEDASITNSDDGIWCAQAIAVVASLCVESSPTQQIIERAMEELPEGSWSRHLAQEANDIASRHDSFISAYPLLTEKIINREYNYGCMAAENLALVLALLQLTHRNTVQGISAGLSFGKVSDSVAPMIGAIVGGIEGQEFLFAEWTPFIRTLKGVCIPEYSGLNYIELVEQFSAYVTT